MITPKRDILGSLLVITGGIVVLLASATPISMNIVAGLLPVLDIDPVTLARWIEKGLFSMLLLRALSWGFLLSTIGIGILLLPRLKVPGRYVALWAVFTYFFVTNAYLSDDAFITFRTSDNFVNGDGLTWNPVERVQGYTNPLWMFLATIPIFFARISSDSLADQLNVLYWGVMMLSYACSFAAVLWIEKAHRRSDYFRLFLYVGVLFSSKAFVDFTSSGLESPLSYLCIALFFVSFVAIVAQAHVTRRELLTLYLVGSIGFVNRMDNLLLYFLPLLYTTFLYWKNNPTRWRQIPLICAIGTFPAYGWLIFSVVYYGFPFPNTFYAKAVIDMDKSIILMQGFAYLRHIAQTDPITVVVILATIIGAFLLRPRALSIISLSILLYLAYVVNVGGDFMGGRFLASPFLLSVIGLSSIGFGLTPYDLPIAWRHKSEKAITTGQARGTTVLAHNKKAAIAVFAIVLTLYNVALPQTPIKGISDSALNSHAGGANGDKSYYYIASNLLSFPITQQFPFSSFHLLVNGFDDCLQLRTDADPVIIGGGGVKGYCSGPEKTLIDPLMLTEPLLVRLPLMDSPTYLPVGHLAKPLPAGLVESYEQQQNLLEDVELRTYYSMILLITQGDIFSRERWDAIYSLNLGGQRMYTSDYIVAP